MSVGEKSLSEAVADRCKEEEEIASGASSFKHIFVQQPEGGSLARLRSISLDRLSISCLDEFKQLREACPNLRDLDLSHNELTSWSEVVSLIDALPSLNQVNVGFNPFNNAPADVIPSPSVPTTDAAPTVDFDDSPKSRLRILILNGTSCGWPMVERFLAKCASLEELHLSCNQYDQVKLPNNCHGNMKRLHFNSNGMSSWEHLEAVGAAFPLLSMLVARDNPMTVSAPSPVQSPSCTTSAATTEEGVEERETLVPCDDDDSTLTSPTHNTPVFGNLKIIMLSETRIASVDELVYLCRRCPSLEELRLQNVPLVNEWPEDMKRYGVIAAMPQVTRLNGSTIDDEEREKAERAFVRHFAHDGAAEPTAKDVSSGLVQKHGSLLPLAEVNLGPPKGKITLHFQWLREGQPDLPDTVFPVTIALSARLDTLCELVAKKMAMSAYERRNMKLHQHDDEVGCLRTITCPACRSIYDINFSREFPVFVTLHYL